MKLTKRIFSAVLVSLVLVLALAPAAMAAGTTATVDITNKKGTFVFGPGSGMSDTDLFPDFKNVMPGDTLTQRIEITSKGFGFDRFNVYMRAVPHTESGNRPQPGVLAVEDDVASMNEFLSQLNLKIWKGTNTSKTPIYNGAPNTADGLSSFILLGEFTKGRTGVLTAQLTVPIDMGNEFASRAGEVDWEFRVDEVEQPKGTSPKTGDSTNVPVLLMVAGLSLAAVVVIILLNRKKK